MKPDSGEETISVTKRDCERDTLVCIDPDRNLWITRGFPRNGDTGLVDKEVMRNLSGPPYVFKADVMNLYDDKHPEGVMLQDVSVIFMHGGREESKNGKWMFSSKDGYPVVETVKAVNNYLKSKSEPPIQVVMACNKSSSPLGIKVGDFESDVNIVYAVSETVSIISAGMSEDGKIHFSAKASDFWGLDQYAISQEINIL